MKSSRRRVVITGATQGIGHSIASQIAAIPNTEVILVCRDQARGEAVAKEISNSTGNMDVRCEVANVANFKSILALRERLCSNAVHVLVNNAAECPPVRKEINGREVQFATNVLGYFWMIRAFADLLRAGHKETGEPSRVVNVASNWAGDLDLDDLEFKRRPYDIDTAYRQSKQADRMLTVSWAELLQPEVLVNSCHPGDPCTKLSTALGYNLHASKDCSSAARTPVYLATHPDVREVTGKWFQSMRASPCQYAGSGMQASRKRLFEICEDLSN